MYLGTCRYMHAGRWEAPVKAVVVRPPPNPAHGKVATSLVPAALQATICCISRRMLGFYKPRYSADF
jgi:hypothetical protein